MELLDRLRLIAGLPTREAIVDRNIMMLGDQAANLSITALREIYRQVAMRIFEAMALELLEPAWFKAVFEPGSASDEAHRTFAAKRLTRAELQLLVAPIAAPVRTLLKRLVDPQSESPSVLEQKLIRGGAPPRIIADAKNLRAHAVIAEIQHTTASIWNPAAELDNVRERLQIRVNGLLSAHEDDPRPAVAVWNELMSKLPTWCNDVDGSRIFQKDSDLLLGEVCEMADLCEIDWGVANAH
jgi:hypothetical protein